MEIKKRENIPENRQVRLTVAVDRGTWQDALMHCYNGIKALCPVEGEPTREKIEAVYGSDFLYQEAVNETYPQALVDAIGQEDISIAGTPTLTVEDIGPDGFTFTALIDLYPEVKLGQYKGLSAVYPQAELSEEDTQAALEEYARAHMTEEHPDRAAMGDEVVLDFEGFVDGKPFDGGKAEGYTLTLGSGAFIPGFEDQLAGMKAGDEKDVVVTFPENYTKELAGKEATFKCKIHEVKETIKPELDDEFAKDVSEFDTLAALKKSIKADLAAKRQEAVDRDFENEAVVLAGKNMTCNIPACMIDEQVDKHLEQFSYQLQSQGMKMDDYLKMIGGDVKGMRDSMRPMAEQTVRSNILLSEIVHQENLDVTEEEVEEELKKMAEQYKMELDKIKEMVDVEAVKSDLKGRKAVKLIVDNAKPVEKEKKTAKKAAKKEDAAEAPAEEAKTEE